MLPSHAIEACQTPAFVLDEARLAANLRAIRSFADRAHCTALYSIKALTLPDVLAAAASHLQGFSVSSLFEARFAREFADDHSRIDFVSPLLRQGEVAKVAELCDRVTLNSFSQFDRFGDMLAGRCEIGLRVNPGTSWATNPRSDPCRADSKLGILLSEFTSALRDRHELLHNVTGLHIHANHRSRNGQHWVATIEVIEAALDQSLRQFRWLNIGGGYLFDDLQSRTGLAAKLRQVSDEYGLEIAIEPGAAAMHDAGFFVTTVEDVLPKAGVTVALLDFSVNHWPELFEYQMQPIIAGSLADGPFTCQLAGCSCLAGDVLGEYTFSQALNVGDRLVLLGAGAYAIAKAHTFNGINLPNIYLLQEDGELRLLRQFTYGDFAARLNTRPSTVKS